MIQSDLLLADFHKIIQTSMGWTNSHLHQFIINQTFYTVRMPSDNTWDEMDNVDYKKMKISDLLKKEEEKIVYEYDFGDSWEHEILVEKIVPAAEKVSQAVCVTGKRACPPEDCGGVWGYEGLLEAVQNPNHPEHEEMREWLEDGFDPSIFDVEEANQQLKKLR